MRFPPVQAFFPTSNKQRGDTMKNLGEFRIQDLKERKNFKFSSLKKIKKADILTWISNNKELFIALLYIIIYSVIFYLLEKKLPNDANYTRMYCSLDDKIPFCEYFLIPYYTWHAFMVITVLYFLLTDTKDYLRSCIMIFGGMTICCIIYFFFPNGQNLRPALDTLRDNLFTAEIIRLWEVDTCTNVFPSIHVYDSVAALIVICKSREFHKNRLVKGLVGILVFLISISTVFLKQHSILDGFGALILAVIMYVITYKLLENKISQCSFLKKKKR